MGKCKNPAAYSKIMGLECRGWKTMIVQNHKEINSGYKNQQKRIEASQPNKRNLGNSCKNVKIN